MREIKFDAIYKPTGEHFEPKKLDFKSNLVVGDFNGVQNDWCYFSLDGERGDVILRQYTGLKDKNSKEIYEGDIVNVNHYGGTPKYEKVHYYTIGGFIGFHPFTDDGHHWSAKLCEVVGNIYENLELLKR